MELGERDRGRRGHEGLKQAVELRQRAGDAMLRKIPNKIVQIHAVRGVQSLKDRLHVPEETQNVQTNRLRQGMQSCVVWRGQNKTSLGASAMRENEQAVRITDTGIISARSTLDGLGRIDLAGEIAP